MDTDTAAPAAQPATPAPAVPVAPIVAAPVATPPAPAPVATPSVAAPAADPTADPNWLNPRLEQARRSEREKVFKELGVADAAAAKAIFDAAKAAEDAQKSELQKAREKASSLEAVAARATVLEQTIKARADVELASLTEAQRSAVTAIAGDDSARVLNTIDALKVTWVAAQPAVQPPPAQPAAPAPVAPVATPAPAPPANTSPAPLAPSGNAPTSPPDHRAEYQSLKAKNPIAAAAYLNKYASEIYPRA